MYERLKRLKDNKTRGTLNEDLFFEPGEINIERSKLKDMGFISKKTGLFKHTLMGLPEGTQFEVKHIYEEDGLVLVSFLLYIGVYFQTTIEPARLHFNMTDRR